MTPVTFEEIRDWLMAREPWPREIQKAIARAALRSEDGRISSNHLLRDPDFHIADNQVNTIPTAFSTCGKHGWLRSVGMEKTETVRGHGRNILVYEVTPAGLEAFRRFAQVGTDDQRQEHASTSPPVVSPDLGDESPESGRRSPSGAAVASSNEGGRETPPGPSFELLTLPGLEAPEATYIDHDQSKAA